MPLKADGTIDWDKLYAEMDESRLDNAIQTLDEIAAERAAKALKDAASVQPVSSEQNTTQPPSEANPAG
jgi:hypothetical protein